MVLGPEAECDHISLSGLEVIRGEDQTAGFVGNGDDMVSRRCSAGEGGSSEDGGEKHIDWLFCNETSSFG